MPLRILFQGQISIRSPAGSIVVRKTKQESHLADAGNVPHLHLYPLDLTEPVRRHVIQRNTGRKAGGGKAVIIVAFPVLFTANVQAAFPMTAHIGVHRKVAVEIAQDRGLGLVCVIQSLGQQQFLHHVHAVDGHDVAQVLIRLARDGYGTGGNKALAVRHAAGRACGQNRTDSGYVGCVSGELGAHVVVGVF